jgi:hypothetical protein
MKKIIDA